MPFSKILIIGAAGQTGLFTTKEALKRGLQLNVLVRTPEKLGDIQTSVTVFKGDATNYQDILESMRGTQAVISLIGPIKDSKPGMQPEATTHIVKAMQELGLKRLITITGGGVPVEGDKPKFADKAIRALMQIVAKKALNDGIDHVEVLKKSHLDWTVVRVPMLNSDPAKGQYQIGMVGSDNLSVKISRADVANFILDILDSNDYNQKLPMISW